MCLLPARAAHRGAAAKNPRNERREKLLCISIAGRPYHKMAEICAKGSPVLSQLQVLRVIPMTTLFLGTMTTIFLDKDLLFAYHQFGYQFVLNSCRRHPAGGFCFRNERVKFETVDATAQYGGIA